MAASASTGMDKSEMRAILKKATPDNPINFAFGQGKEAGFALLKIDKLKNPKACGRMLEDEFKDAKNTRWGTLTVNPDVDSAMVRFMVNKPVSGMAKRLTKTLKGTGFSKVEIVLEDGTLVEGGSDEEDEAPAAEPAAAEAFPAQAAEGTPDPEVDGAADLHKTLAGLMKRIAAAIAADPEAKEGLVKLATAANAAMKGNDPAGASTAIEQLAKALGAGASHQTAPVDLVALQKTRMIWDAQRKKFASDILVFKDAVIATIEDDPEAPRMIDALEDQLDGILDNLDDQLLDLLDAAIKQQDPAKRAGLIDDARSVVAEYIKYAETDPLLVSLGTESGLGAVLNVGKQAAATLKKLSQALQ